MKRKIISIVFTIVTILIFTISFSVVSGVSNSYAAKMQGGGYASSTSGSHKTTPKNKKNKKNENKAKKKLNSLGAGCL